MTAKRSAQSRQGLNPYFVLAVVSFGVFIAADDLTVVSTMLVQMLRDLDISIQTQLDEAAWIVNAYLIAYVVAMPFMGRVSDIFGRRVVFVGCLAIFAFGSVLVILAPNLQWMVVARAVTAIGGGAMVPVAIAVIGDVFSPERRPFSMGILGAVDTAGWIWGPLYGAMLVRYLSWRWQFYLNLPLSALAAALAFYALRDLPSPAVSRKRGRQLDVLGVVLLTVALLAVNIGLTQAGGGLGGASPSFDFDQPQATHSSPGRAAPIIVVGAITFGLFALAERRQAIIKRVPPLIDLTMFRRRNFNLACLVNFSTGFVLIIAMVNVPIFVNVILGETIESAALESGQILSALTIAMAIASVVGGWLCERFGYRLPTLLGLAFMGSAFLLMGTTWEVDVNYGPMAVHLALAGAGFGLVIAPTATAVVDDAAAEQRGVASALVIVLRLMGMTIGLSVLTAWGLHRFDVLGKAELPPLTDPGYLESLTRITARVLRETFLISGVVALVTFLPAGMLHGREHREQLFTQTERSNVKW
jgi:EmrB/QacA subfamily drug resistance transporter